MEKTNGDHRIFKTKSIEEIEEIIAEGLEKAFHCKLNIKIQNMDFQSENDSDLFDVTKMEIRIENQTKSQEFRADIFSE